MGKKFIAADSDTRKEIFAEQVQKLRLFHIILGYLEVQEEIDSETVMKDISTALPYENAEKVLQTMIAWGRYAGLMDYDANTADGDQTGKRDRERGRERGGGSLRGSWEEKNSGLRSSGVAESSATPDSWILSPISLRQRASAPCEPPDACQVEQRLP